MINILISVNSTYLDKAKTMLYSIRMHTKEPVEVYLINHCLTQVELLNFEKYLSKKCKMKLTTIDALETEFDSFPVKNFSIEMYYRVLAQFLLPQTVDRILWLDADIVIVKDLTDFYYQDFEGAPYVVCLDAASNLPEVRAVKEKIGLSADENYFNSGVMLMNLALLRRETVYAEIMDICYQLKDRLTYPDQDILNFLYGKTVKYVDWNRYNFQTAGVLKIDKSLRKDVAVIHYSGGKKPWIPKKMDRTAVYYWRVRVRQGHLMEAIRAYRKSNLSRVIPGVWELQSTWSVVKAKIKRDGVLETVKCGARRFLKRK